MANTKTPEEEYLAQKMQDVHQIKMENSAISKDPNKGFVVQEIPKMQMIENLRLQQIRLRRERKA